MDVQPIKMHKFEARETLQQYRALIKERRTKWDLAIMKSAKAILQGRQVIRLQDAIVNGGFDNHLPKLAVCRADDPWVRCVRWNGSLRLFGISSRGEWVSEHGRDGYINRTRLKQPRGFQWIVSDVVREEVVGEAMAPSIPPAHRPVKTALTGYYILWEAQWKRVPPVDPMLLAPLGEGMFAVMAVWDLSPLERAVLAQERGT